MYAQTEFYVQEQVRIVDGNENSVFKHYIYTYVYICMYIYIGQSYKHIETNQFVCFN